MNKILAASAVLAVGLSLSACGSIDKGTAQKHPVHIPPSPTATVTVTADPTPVAEPVYTNADVVDYAHAAGFPDLALNPEVDDAVGDLCSAMEGRRLDSEWTARSRDGFARAFAPGTGLNRKQAGQLYDVLVEGCVKTGRTTLWAPRSHDDVVKYLRDHGYNYTNDEDVNASLAESCDAVNNTQPGTPKMRQDRAAWLEAGETDAFVDTLFEGCYATGHATRWAPPPPPPPATSFGTGTWLVGEDIASGTYRGGGEGCYWERLSGLGGDFEDIITNYFGDGPTVVTISSSDVAFATNDCGTWEKIG